MSKKWLFFSFIFLFTAATCMAQQAYLSTSQQKCQWHSQTNTFVNCVQQQESFEIKINDSLKTITLTNNGVKHVYTIISINNATNETEYLAVAATGIGMKVTLSPSQHTFVIIDQPKTTKTTYYLNH